MWQVYITDLGSKQQYDDVQIEGVPAGGVIDSGWEGSYSDKLPQWPD